MALRRIFGASGSRNPQQTSVAQSATSAQTTRVLVPSRLKPTPKREPFVYQPPPAPNHPSLPLEAPPDTKLPTVTLRSSDGYTVEVVAHRLLMGSTVFDSMMDAAQTSQVPIDIDVSKNVLINFLLMMFRGSYIQPDIILPLSDIEAILSLGEMYDCPSIREGVVRELTKNAYLHAWKVFKFAANLDEPALAKLALSFMYIEVPKLRRLRNKRMTVSLMEGITPKYLAALIRAMDTAPRDNERDKGRTWWAHVSTAFTTK